MDTVFLGVITSTIQGRLIILFLLIILITIKECNSKNKKGYGLIKVNIRKKYICNISHTELDGKSRSNICELLIVFENDR